MPVKQLAAAALVAAITFSSGASGATKIADPKAFITSMYGTLAKGGEPGTGDDIFTPRIVALRTLDTKEAHGEVGRMDLDIWTGGQDWKVSDVHVTAAPTDGVPTREIVVAKFKDFGKPSEMHFYFEKTAAGWKLDDIVSPLSGQDQVPWTYSLVLKYG